ncbi:MAG: hypothetical protein PHY92_01615 [Alphaproteobacteria bacterium]|nr:hypothetical protein [Alphaproteobacteria bacterium]
MFEPDGAFGFCLADHAYDDGRKLTAALSPSREINLGLTIPGGQFSTGKQYDLILSLDRAEMKEVQVSRFERSVRAVAVDGNSLLLQMGNSRPFVKALTDSRNLSVSASGKTVAFALPPFAAVLGNLKDCNKENLGKTKRPTAAPGMEMPKALMVLLATAGFKDVTPLSMNNLPEDKRPSDHVWKTGELLGGVRERLAPKDKSLTELAGLHIDGLKKKCSGAFSASVGREEDYAGLKMRAAEASCHMKETGGKKSKDVVVALLFYLTAAGRFTVFTHEGLASSKAEAEAARDALKRTIIGLAREDYVKQR